MMKALGELHNFAIQNNLFGRLFYTEVRVSAGDRAFYGCCCHIS